MTQKTNLRQALSSGKLLLTAECVPPRAGGGDAVGKLSNALPENIDAVVVADNPDGIYGSALACGGLLAREGREVVLSLSTRDRNRVALESEVLGASALGIGAILCLSGNHQSLGVCPQAASANDIDSVQLTQMVKALEEAPGLLAGAIAHPHQRPLELNLLRLRKKVAAGTDFLLTEPVFDLPAFIAWMDAVRAAGLHERAAIVATVLPLTSPEQAQRLQQRQTYGPIGDEVVQRVAAAADPAKEGVAIAGAVAAQLRSIPGLRGIHVLSSGAEALAGDVLAAAGLA
jgi:methylenetetrahydrofolate reductase (NADPH)